VEEPSYATHEEAAGGDIPAGYSPAIAVSVSLDGSEAIVLLGTNGPPDYYPYQEWVEKQEDGGWLPMDGSNMQFGGTLWDEAPADAQTAVVAWQGREYEVPVVERHFQFCPWDFGQPLIGHPKLKGFR
jgi:hypothetical protein